MDRALLARDEAVGGPSSSGRGWGSLSRKFVTYLLCGLLLVDVLEYAASLLDGDAGPLRPPIHPAIREQQPSVSRDVFLAAEPSAPHGMASGLADIPAGHWVVWAASVACAASIAFASYRGADWSYRSGVGTGLFYFFHQESRAGQCLELRCCGISRPGQSISHWLVAQFVARVPMSFIYSMSVGVPSPAVLATAHASRWADHLRGHATGAAAAHSGTGIINPWALCEHFGLAPQSYHYGLGNITWWAHPSSWTWCSAPQRPSGDRKEAHGSGREALRHLLGRLLGALLPQELHQSLHYFALRSLLYVGASGPRCMGHVGGEWRVRLEQININYNTY